MAQSAFMSVVAVRVAEKMCMESGLWMHLPLYEYHSISSTHHKMTCVRLNNCSMVTYWSMLFTLLFTYNLLQPMLSFIHKEEQLSIADELIQMFAGYQGIWYLFVHSCCWRIMPLIQCLCWRSIDWAPIADWMHVNNQHARMSTWQHRYMERALTGIWCANNSHI